MLISMPSEDCAIKLMKRSVTVRSIIELWARSTTKEHLDDQLKILPTEFTFYFKKENTFKVVVDTFNKVTSQEDKIKKIEVGFLKLVVFLFMYMTSVIISSLLVFCLFLELPI